MYTKVLAFLVLITISMAACPANTNINNFLAGTAIPNPDSVSFKVNASQAVASQTYDYQFQTTFTSTPAIAFGTLSLTQPCRALHSTLQDPTLLALSLHLSLPLVHNSSSSTLIESGHLLKSISGSVVIQKFKSASLMLVIHNLIQLIFNPATSVRIVQLSAQTWSKHSQQINIQS